MGHFSDTGFGIVTTELATRFLARGIDVRIIAVNHRGEPVKGPLQGRVWPADIRGVAYGGNVSGPAIDGSLWTILDSEDVWQPDAVLAVADMSGLFGHIGEAMAQWKTLPVFHYCPIEGDNLNPSWKDVWSNFQPVAMSGYGAKVIGDLIGQPVPMVYHGVDSETFRPVSFRDPMTYKGKRVVSKETAKSAIGMNPNRKLIFRSDRLVERKFYDRFLTTMGLVFAQDPDVDVLIHCAPSDPPLNLFEEATRLPEEYWPRIKVSGEHTTFKGLSRPDLVSMMNAADLYVSTTGGEGFGLNLAEALACEVPVVVTDWAADREVVGPGGIAVPPLTDTHGEPVRYHSSYGMDWAVPDPKAFVEPILTLLSRTSRRRAMGAEGRAHVIRSFSWDRATDQFCTLFEEAHARSAVAV